MSTFLSPDIYAREVDFSFYVKQISTSVCGMVGVTERGPINKATLVTSWEQFFKKFGSYIQDGYLAYAARSFFDNGGSVLWVNRVAHLADPTDRSSLTATCSSVTLPDRSGGYASRQTGVSGEDQITWQSREAGAEGIFVEILASGNDTPLSISVSGKTIVVNLATDSSGIPISAADQVVVAVMENTQANALVQATTQDTGVVQPAEVGMLMGGQEGADSLLITAANEGVWGDDLSVQLEDGTLAPDNNFNIIVYQKDTAVEVFKDLSMDESAKNHVELVINGSSDYIRVSDLNSASGTAVDRPEKGSYNLSGGDDGLADLADSDFIGDPAQRTGLFCFDEVDSLNMLAVPGITTANMIHAGIAYAESRKDFLFICEAPIHLEPQEAVDFRKGQGEYSHGAFNSSYAAMYYPWLEISDPLSGVAKKIPPSGAVAGCIARSDHKTNIWNAPAGIDRGRIFSVLSLGYKTSRGERDVLYPEGINVIASFPGSGINIWGQKTLQSQPSALDRINVRRLLMYLEESISSSSRFVVFEPNNELTWRALLRVINPFLQDIKDKGGLYDFATQCDEETNTPAVTDQNKLVTRVFVKPTKTAEFIELNFILTSTGAQFSEVV